MSLLPGFSNILHKLNYVISWQPRPNSGTAQLTKLNFDFLKLIAVAPHFFLRPRDSQLSSRPVLFSWEKRNLQGCLGVCTLVCFGDNMECTYIDAAVLIPYFDPIRPSQYHQSNHSESICAPWSPFLWLTFAHLLNCWSTMIRFANIELYTAFSHWKSSLEMSWKCNCDALRQRDMSKYKIMWNNQEFGICLNFF